MDFGLGVFAVDYFECNGIGIFVFRGKKGLGICLSTAIVVVEEKQRQPRWHKLGFVFGVAAIAVTSAWEAAVANHVAHCEVMKEDLCLSPNGKKRTPHIVRIWRAHAVPCIQVVACARCQANLPPLDRNVCFTSYSCSFLRMFN